QIEAAWKRWAESTRCDADGRHNLYGLQSLAMRAIAESGEVLLRMRPRRVSDGLEIPMQLQLLEADHLDTSKDGDAERTGHTIVQGVEFNAIGRRVAYWVFRTHPGDARSSASRQSVRVTADRMLHLFRVDRPGQVRGVPWAAPIAVRAHELKDYEDAQLLRQKIAACFAVFREDTNVEMEPGPAAQAAQSEEGELGRDSVEPGMIEDLPAGKKVTFAQPPGVGGYDEFVTRQLRAVASGFGVSYEALTGDYSTVNFASGRMGHVEFQRNVTTWQNDLMVMQLCRPVWAWFEEAAELAGVRNEGLDPSWILPRREMFDPTR
ncbi:MAG: phage portal protein, partial [Planctomycetota bacterium]